MNTNKFATIFIGIVIAISAIWDLIAGEFVFENYLKAILGIIIFAAIFNNIHERFDILEKKIDSLKK